MDKRRRSSVLLVVGIVAAILFIVAVTLVSVNMRTQNQTERTVGDAFTEIMQRHPQNVARSNSARSEASDDDTARLLELAQALGLPDETLPSFATADEAREAKRQSLRQELEGAVGLGQLSPHEANAVLRAYDLGLVTTPYSVYIPDSGGASSGTAN